MTKQEKAKKILLLHEGTTLSITEVAELYEVSEDEVQKTIGDCLDEFLDDGYLGGKMPERAIKRLGMLLNSDVAYRYQKALLDAMF